MSRPGSRTAGAEASGPPLLRLWRYAVVGHPRRMMLATACSVLNKLFDLAPPVLIGAAVDIVVRREGSLISPAAWLRSSNRPSAFTLATGLRLYGCQGLSHDSTIARPPRRLAGRLDCARRG